MLLLQAHPVESVFSGATWLFPTMECLHLLGFAVAIGTIAMVDVSLLGLGFDRKATSQVLRDVAPWTLTALVVVVMAGGVIFSADPDDYLVNRSFRFKIGCLIVAILFNYTIHRRVAQSADASRLTNCAAAITSLTLWACVVAGGLFIAFVG